MAIRWTKYIPRWCVTRPWACNIPNAPPSFMFQSPDILESEPSLQEILPTLPLQYCHFNLIFKHPSICTFSQVISASTIWPHPLGSLQVHCFLALLLWPDALHVLLFSNYLTTLRAIFKTTYKGSFVCIDFPWVPNTLLLIVYCFHIRWRNMTEYK